MFGWFFAALGGNGGVLLRVRVCLHIRDSSKNIRITFAVVMEIACVKDKYKNLPIERKICGT